MRVSISLLTCWIVVLGLSVFVVLGNLPVGLDNDVYSQIIWQLRVPQALTAIVVGASLAVSASILQVLLRNPLADPGIVGVNSGASLFAAFYLLLIAGGESIAFQYGLPLMSFVGALCSSLLIYAIARRVQGAEGTSVILAGIGVSTVSGAIIGWLYLVSDAQALRSLTFWLMGSLQHADFPLVLSVSPVVLACLVYVIVQGEKLNWFYFGFNTAQVAGVNAKRFFFIWLSISALLVAVAVSLAGSIAFVGLLVPHLIRQLHPDGYDHKFLLHASALLGAILMLLVLCCQRWLGGISLPVSMLTATFGGPVFIIAMLRQHQRA